MSAKVGSRVLKFTSALSVGPVTEHVNRIRSGHVCNLYSTFGNKGVRSPLLVSLLNLTPIEERLF